MKIIIIISIRIKLIKFWFLVSLMIFFYKTLFNTPVFFFFYCTLCINILQLSVRYYTHTYLYRLAYFLNFNFVYQLN